MVEDIRRHLEAALEVTGTMRWSEQNALEKIVR